MSLSAILGEASRNGVKLETDAEEFNAKLALGRPLVVKYGIDPTNPSVHLGHTVPLRILRRFQDAGHKAVIIIGDFTATIGDPSGKNKTRPTLSDDQIAGNMKTYLRQIGKFVDLPRAEVFYNSWWLRSMVLSEIVAEFSHITVKRMLDRKDFSDRIAEHEPVFLHEFIYPVVQGIDSREVLADVELGGTEQLYTLMLARDIQERDGQLPQSCITVPILRGVDGKKRMGKSLGNFIGVDEPPDEIFGKTMSIPDDLMPEWYGLLCSREFDPNEHPKEAKMDLAYDLVEQCWTREDATRAKGNWLRRFAEGEDPEDISEVTIELPPRGQMDIISLLVAMKLVASKSEARRAIVPNPKKDAGGEKSSVTVGPHRWKVRDVETLIILQDKMVVRVGKRKMARLRFPA